MKKERGGRTSRKYKEEKEKVILGQGEAP